MKLLTPELEAELEILRRRVIELEEAIHWARMELGDHYDCECKLCLTVPLKKR